MAIKTPLILITNDDGISSKGIRSLWEAVEGMGERVIVAPDSAQSGMGHAITIHDPLRMEDYLEFGNTQAKSCTGTPVDCVKLAIYEVMKQRPTLLLSGINHGANTSTNVLYSGTMSAAVEGAMEGIPSIGFSLDSFDANADFNVAKSIVKEVVRTTIDKGLPEGVCLNVNVPYVERDAFKGIKICRQAHAFWADRFDKREDQFGKKYYWLTGDFLDQDKTSDTDLYWIEKGYATIVPTQFDMTAYEAIKELENWKL